VISRFVADASMAIAWAHPGQANDESNAWLAHLANGAELIEPSLWTLEIANALLVLQRRRRITAGERAEALTLLGAIPVAIDHSGSDRALKELSALAHAEGLSVYDAAYLDLSLRLKLPLACKDGPLASAASRRRVRIKP
jgi:predicted nucleic acid-binding protein